MAAKYQSITDPALEADARQKLRAEQPDLTDHDIELLWGSVAQQLLDADRGESTDHEAR